MFTPFEVYQGDFLKEVGINPKEDKQLFFSWLSAKLSVEALNKIIELEKTIKEKLKNKS